MLRSGNLWAFSAMAFCSAFVVYLYFTHFPAYLKERHHLPEVWGWVAGLPMLSGAVGCTLGGLLTDWLVRRTGSRRWGRRIMGLVGKGGGAALLLAGACMDDALAAVVLISLSAFTADLSLAAHWAVATDAGGRFVGTVFGFMNTVAAVAHPLAAAGRFPAGTAVAQRGRAARRRGSRRRLEPGALPVRRHAGAGRPVLAAY